MGVSEAISIGLGFLAIVAPDFWPKMPKALSFSLAGIGLAWLGYSLVLGIQEYTGMKLGVGPLSTIVAGFVLMALGLFWHISQLGSRAETQQASNHSTHPAQNAQAVAKSIPDTKLFLDCWVVGQPNYSSAGLLYAFPAAAHYKPESVMGGLVQYFGQPGSPFKLDNVHFYHRCELSNYGTDPIVKVSLVFPMSFREAVKHGEGSQGGREIVRTNWTIDIPKIDPGPSNAFVFYLFHIGPQFIAVDMPERATFSLLGKGPETYEAPITTPTLVTPIFLSPWDFPISKSPPEQPHPTQEQQGTPEKK